MAAKPPTLRFCGECNNLLYPKSDNNSKVLLYSCRNCLYSENAVVNPQEDAACVYRNDLLTREREQAGQTKDLETDPTLLRSTAVVCPVCEGAESVVYQDQARRLTTNMTLFYVCINCKSLFRDPNVKTR
ncbi:uncharacterized protein MKK02DRAFT_39612 [Dioszegia hungarica]|uniref:DNA-directed RNA polymerase subunit n=1 Tax=Dioszegia hungarica TaxID=4972 RepID=A0AA38LX64_9TREE|nr:uncharacterized protein MKK02DRAFT_39612 [Dioszegia hungarica]KAI9639315.1 hypothetical protein MKK02DRAFT_39612 [Dioszegia hungarica]